MSSQPAPAVRVLTPLERENGLRAQLGLLAKGDRLPQRARLLGWLGPLLMTLFGGSLRFINLGWPARIFFDETYYVKDAFTLSIFGFATKWEPVDKSHVNQFFDQGDYREMTDVALYVVHGDLGKWLIAGGMQLFGADNPFGWRFSSAVAGTLMILLVGRIAMRLFRSAPLATLAATLVAIDGVGITLSRIGLLDIFLALLILAGFWAVLVDREVSRARLAHRYAQDGWWRSGLGPGTGVRWWLLIAGVFVGAAAGVKWSGFYAAAVLGLAAWVWDLQARRIVGVRNPLMGSVLKGGFPAFVTFVPATLAAYLATWTSWFLHPDSYMHQWAANLRASGKEVPRAWLPDSWNSFWEYHLRMYDFHSGLEKPHTYMAHPVGWLLQLRPTSFYWQNYENADADAIQCVADRCLGAITSLGNPFIWWAAAVALVAVIWFAVRRQDGVAGVILTGYAATYLPWFLYSNRTIFQFYTITILPFVALALTYGVKLAWNHPVDSTRKKWRRAIWVVGGLVIMASLFWWPLWTGQTVPYWFWRAHMWLPTWP